MPSPQLCLAWTWPLPHPWWHHLYLDFFLSPCHFLPRVKGSLRSGRGICGMLEASTECPAWLREELGTFSSPGILLHHGDFGFPLVWAIPWVCGQDCSLLLIPREAHSPSASRPCEVLRTKILHSAPQQIILSHQKCSFHPSQAIPAAAAASPRLAREGDCGEILGNPVSSAGRRSLRAPCEIKLCAHICKCLGQRLS